MRKLLQFFKHPDWPRQHRWRQAIWRSMARLGLNGMHLLPMHQRWVDIRYHPMPLKNLDRHFEGMKLVHISDLHFSPVVWRRYLGQYVKWINELEPDLVVITGDLITGGYRYAHRIAHVLKHFQATHGIVCILGNHDYGMLGKKNRPRGELLAGRLTERLREHGITVLRNQSILIREKKALHPLTIVGLDDDWSGHQDAQAAFQDVDPRSPILCLNHNPANCRQLLRYPWQWMLSGHTHGRQLGTGRISRTLIPHRRRHYTYGHYTVQGRHLYVNRGLSYGQRIHDWCRPEVTVFELESA